ncbi:MAG TPA: ribonuclease P protein component [Anaerolineaceae bacterium]|nr:ribonuclease P protein component [Anaerolineaceae bacterium]HQP08675.1 ribonuclease P protein component [Anaerolineaceae bacterium]
MKRRFRLRNTTDFKRVRATGKAYTHPFFVLLVTEGESNHSRLGISVQRKYGSAVERNLVKRRIRSIAAPWMDRTERRWDGIVIIKNQARQAEYNQLQEALAGLFIKARLITNAE